MFKLSTAALALTLAVPAFAHKLPASSQLPFASAQQMVDIGGRRLNLFCSGSGPVTVIFEAYGTGTASSWHAVQPQVARHTRACVYDRAGLGFSDPSPRIPTASNAADDLHKLLAAANIAPPYILAASSFGGAVAQLYAYRFPADVKGMVLVEPMHEDEEKRLEKVTQGKIKMMREMEAQMRAACTAQAETGFTPGTEMFAQCIGNAPASRGKALAAADRKMRSKPAYWKAMNAEVNAWAASGQELRAARKPFGNVPIIVLTRSISPYATPGQPQSALNKAMEDENQLIMRDMAALSSKGELRRIAGAPHVVHETRPEAVVQAIGDMLKKVSR